MNDIVIRPALQDDPEVLWDFLAIAAYEPDAPVVKAVPLVVAHLAGWKREQDFGFIAEHEGVPIGAAWARQFSLEEEPAFYVNQRAPEPSIGVKEHARGLSVGEQLLRALIAEATRGGLDLCLNVRDDNPALRLYQRMTFLKREVRDAH